MQLIAREKVYFLIPILKWLCILAAFGSTTLLLAKFWYFDSWIEKQETIIYSLPLVFLIFIWASCKLEEKPTWHLEVLFVDSVAILLAASRLFALFFHSGHVLFLLYTYVTTSNRIYRLLCLPMVLVTAYFKIIYWGDFITPVIGAILAMILIEWRAWAVAKVESESI